MKTIIFAWLLVILATTFPKGQGGNYYLGSHIIDVPKTIKETHLHFFMHDTTAGDNRTSVLVAKPKNTVVTLRNQAPFGAVNVFDDPLTEGPDIKSKVIGNARGLYSSVSRGSDPTVLFNGDLEFTNGEFNGSSLIAVSRDALVVVKEMAIVGGRGKFRMAKGFVLVNVIFLNTTSGVAILEWNVTVFHP